jgi:hypothetical protein
MRIGKGHPGKPSAEQREKMKKTGLSIFPLAMQNPPLAYCSRLGHLEKKTPFPSFCEAGIFFLDERN